MSSIGYSNIKISDIDNLIPSANNKASEFYNLAGGIRFRGLDRVHEGATWNAARIDFSTGLKKLSDFAGYFKFEGLRFGYLYNFHAVAYKEIGPPGTNWRPPADDVELYDAFNPSTPNTLLAQGTYEEGGYPRNEPVNDSGTHIDISYYSSGYSYDSVTSSYFPRTNNLILSGVRHHSAGSDFNRGVEGRWITSESISTTNCRSFIVTVSPSGSSYSISSVISNNRKNDGCSLRLVNTNSSDIAAWSKGDTITIEGLIYNIEKSTDGSLLYLVQNYAGTKYKDGTDIPFFTGGVWDNSDPKMCAYFDQIAIATYTNHF